ncbi:lipid-A-disaccharide synthase [Leptolyngbya sp. FACHB-261]|uniref:lipid-A-disaccharide synthase n=1 Tax=Leptolyngbya sp. FACHB-261 TaxID=2692806 RepID=UPI0016883450|nr:lipid-A-disaccharide synthase [Leptolyngbya sp. FACHB-261]MBD2101173.1 lipid-A-disaccharide synthase [Leptolyngbya sp. FACHB-261]
MARILISTGEVSGDLHGAALIYALQRLAPEFGLDVEIQAVGGNRMAATGVKFLGNTGGIGSVGLLEALPFIVPALRLQFRVREQLRRTPPDVVVLIDYVGFNFSLGQFAKQHLHSRIVYYIAPQSWVWAGTAKTEQIAKLCDRILAIFADEARHYTAYGAQARWVGHPLIDLLRDVPGRTAARAQLGIPPHEKAVVLLPASRHQEIRALMPVMFAAARRVQARMPDVRFWVPLSLSQFRPQIEQAIAKHRLRASVINGQAHVAIAAADLVIAKSGTVNLETALLNVPQVVMYRVNPVTAWIARRLLGFKIPFMSPPNLVQMQPIVPEFLQEQATPEKISRAALDLLIDPELRQQMQDGYAQVRAALLPNHLGQEKVLDRVAREILSLLTQ